MTIPPTPHTPEGWDAASRGYAEKLAATTERYAAAVLERLDLRSDSRVLEVGAGSGALTVHLAARAGSVLATDFSPAMIEIVRARLQKSGRSNVECAVMDGQALDVGDGQFDRAASHFAIMLFPNRARGFAELWRALRPEGRAVVSAWRGPEEFPAFGLFFQAVRTAVPDLPPPPGPPPIFSLADMDRFKAEMEAAGFRQVQVDRVPDTLEVASADEFWEMMTAGAPPARALFARIGPSNVQRTREVLGEMLVERFGDGPIRFTNFATVGTGIR